MNRNRTAGILTAAVLTLAVAGCGDDDASRTTDDETPTNNVVLSDYPPCPGPQDTITEEIASGCTIDGKEPVLMPLRVDTDGCVVVIWDENAEGGWGFLGETPSDGRWTDMESYTEACRGR